jgi:hypothetical protein
MSFLQGLLGLGMIAGAGALAELDVSTAERLQRDVFDRVNESTGRVWVRQLSQSGGAKSLGRFRFKVVDPNRVQMHGKWALDEALHKMLRDGSIKYEGL